MDGRVYWRSSGGSWVKVPSGWTLDGPGACICDGKLHIVVRGGSNTIWYGWVDLNTGAFSGWSKLPGLTPSRPALACSSDCSLYLVVRGMDDGVWLNVKPPGGGWRRLPGRIYEGPSAAVTSNILNLVVRGGGSSIWHGRLNLTTDDWLGWSKLPGATPSSPALTSSPDGKLYLAVRGMDNRIHWNRFDGGSWLRWRPIPTGSTGDGPGIAVSGSSLHVAVRGLGNDGVYVNTMSLADEQWQGWEKLSGATPSEPQIC